MNGFDITIKDNFLDNDIYEEIYNLANNYNNFTKSKTHWPKTLYKQDEIEVGNVSVSDDTGYKAYLVFM